MAQGQRKITVKFQPVGHKALEKAIKNLAKVQKDLERNVKNLNKTYQLSAKDVDKYRQRVEANTKATNQNSTAITRLQSFIAQYRNKLLLAAFAVTAYSKTIGRLTDLYATQELAEKKLTAALGFKSTALLDAASAMQENTTYGDEVTIQAMAQVAAFTKNESAIASVAAAAQDMASAKGMDLITTTDLITKSVFSSTNALSRYGITIDSSLKGTDRLNAMMEQLKDKFGGAAAADVDTYAGALLQLQATFGDVGEGIGSVLADGLKPLIKILNEFGKLLKRVDPELLAKGIAAIGIAAVSSTSRVTALNNALAQTSVGAAMGLGKGGGGFKGLSSIGAGFLALGKSLKPFLKRFIVASVAIEVVSRAFEALSGVLGDSEKDTQEYDIGLTQLQKTLIETGGDIKKLTQIQSLYSKELQDQEDDIKDRIATGEKLIDNAVEIAAAEAKMFQQYPRADEPLSDGSLDIERVFELRRIGAQKLAQAEADLELHVNKNTKAHENLATASEALNKAREETQTLVASTIPSLEKEIYYLELQHKFKGVDLEVEKALGEAKRQNVILTNDQVNKITTLVHARENLKKVISELTVAETQLRDLMDEQAGMSEYAKSLDNYQKTLTKYQELIVAAESRGVDEEGNVFLTEAEANLLKTYSKILQELEKDMDDLKDKNLNVLTEETENFILDTTDAMNKLNNSTKTQSDLDQELINDISRLQTIFEQGSQEFLDAANAIDILNQRIDDADYEEYAQVIKQLTDQNKSLTDSNKSQIEILEDQLAAFEAQLFTMDPISDAYNDLNIQVQAFRNNIQNLKNNTVDLTFTQSFFVTNMNAMASAMASASLAGEHMGKSVNRALIQIAHTLAAKAAIFGLMRLIFPSVPLGGFMEFMGLQPTATQSNLQGGVVKGYNMGGYVAPQMFSGGGMVDTVPSMLSEGEFVMNRRAVDSIGVENLNRMNRDGSSGQSVNVNFTGNVMSQDFIESEAIPRIKDAIRRGADIGIG